MILVFVAALEITVQASYAQNNDDDNAITNEQVTLSEELTNNPLAQDILKKIEQTKKWIADLEERNYEQLEKQKDLEEKRRQSLVKLNQDLKEWESLGSLFSKKLVRTICR